MPPALSKTCVHGHSNWAVNKDGGRRCRTCANNYNKKRRVARQLPSWSDGKRNTGNRGGRLDTYSRSEIMEARGYSAQTTG